MARIQVSNNSSGHIIVSFPCDPLLIATAKSIPGRKWHPVEKHWSFPNNDGTRERILEAFQGHEIHIDPSFQDTVTDLQTEHNDVAESLPSPPPPESATSPPGSGRDGVIIDKEASGTLKITFPYRPLLAEKVKTLKGRKWHPEEKYWSVPYSEGIVEKILKVFDGVEVHLDPALKDVTSVSSSGKDPSLGGPSSGAPAFEKKGLGKFSGKDKMLVPRNFSLKIFDVSFTRKYRFKTVKGYLYFNRDFLKFSGKAASEIKDGDIKDYLLYLAEEKESATATINQAINALKFYYGTMLRRKFVYEVRRPRKDKKLPTVLSQEEVVRVLTSLENLKHRTLLRLVYASGLRVSEVLKLRVEDIDRDRMLLNNKGARIRKDRCTMLSHTALEILNGYLEKYRPGKWLFEGAREGRYLLIRTAQAVFVFEQAKDKAGIKKDISIHGLRHYAEFRTMPSNDLNSRQINLFPLVNSA